LGARRCVAHALEFGAAKLPAAKHLGAPAGTLDAAAVERDRVLAGADQDFAWPLGHCDAVLLLDHAVICKKTEN
jgi:hypothetical protein